MSILRPTPAHFVKTGRFAAWESGVQMTTPSALDNPLNNPLDDDQQRIKALNPSESFIVEAPAGSARPGFWFNASCCCSRACAGPNRWWP